ncbi:hypothetical protein ABNX05_11095 [Lysinibacillus sp. M3]|uniref:SLH domain-containing protein n=1 Tax=Lysinibacillus zambalensis TaxID=3160866 RepID=A0ABV1MTD6_9BACI
MFIVNYITNNVQYNEDFGFKSYKDAELFLVNKNFIKKNGYFEKDYSGWLSNTTAFVKSIEIKGGLIK